MHLIELNDGNSQASLVYICHHSTNPILLQWLSMLPDRSLIVCCAVDIRVSVDALCRDDTGQISHDPHTKNTSELSENA